MHFKNRNDYMKAVPQDEHFIIQELTFKSAGAADRLGPASTCRSSVTEAEGFAIQATEGLPGNAATLSC